LPHAAKAICLDQTVFSWRSELLAISLLKARRRKEISMAHGNSQAMLADEAADFERISGDLKRIIAQVEGTAGALVGQWQGRKGAAVQAALDRFREAAARQVHALNDISGMIHASGVYYASTQRDSATAAVGLPSASEPRPGDGELP
jgi:WXG100 family type VII secretion target